nr:heavy metal-binding domain-containing protein [Shewanella putrefaciens]
MHPDVTGGKEDTCPQCGMNLEPKAAEAKPAEGAVKNAHKHH